MAKIKINETSFVDTDFVIAVYGDVVLSAEHRLNIILGHRSCGYLGKIVTQYDGVLAETITSIVLSS